MSEESNLLKEVIADAKAIRATAVANAKLALQEHFSEVVHATLSEKLKEELQDDEEISLSDLNTGGAALPPPVVPSSEVAPVPSVAVPPVVPPVDTVVPPVAVAPEVPSVPPAAPTDGIPPTTDELSTPIQETEDPQGEKVKYTVIGNTPSLKDSSPSDPKKPLAGEKTKDELKSAGQFKDQYKDGTPTIKEEKSSDEKDELDNIKEELEKGAEDDKDKDVVEETQVAPATAPVAETEETINFDELMAEIEGTAPAVAPVAQTEPLMESLRSEVANLKKNNSQLNEVVSYLRGKLNELNLLNAKLLYTNKLFKAGNLGNDQKMKIVETMDLTKNVREVKLVYSTLAESISFGAKSPVAPSPKKVAVTTITEGLASKPVASTKPTKEVLTEGTEMASRFQKLAGIKKQVL